MFVTPREYSQYSLGPTGQQPSGSIFGRLVTEDLPIHGV